MTRREVAKFSWRDAEALPRYEAMLERLAAFIEPTLLMTPPNPGRAPRVTCWGWPSSASASPGWDARAPIGDLHGAATRVLDRWFESEELKATLATDAIIGTKASPSMPGTAYVLFHHVMGECDGVRGVWGYVRGGMGGLSTALAAAARAHGAQVRVQAEVRHSRPRWPRVRRGARRWDGDPAAGVVVSSCDPRVTFVGLLILPSCRRTSGRTSSA